MACIGMFITMILFKYIGKHNIGKYLTLGYLINHNNENDKEKEKEKEITNNK